MPHNARDMRESRAPGHNDLRSRGCPDPERAVIYTRRPRTSRARVGGPATPPSDSTPAQHTRNIELLERNMAAMQARVQYCRECGDDAGRQEAAARARELRHAYLTLTGGVERRIIEVDQGSAVNPMVAV